MARKNKKELELIREENAKIAFEKAKAEYPTRLMKVMAEYSRIHRYEFKKMEDELVAFEFCVDDDDGYTIFAKVVPAEITNYDELYDLECIERTVEEHYEAEREQQRRYEVLKEARRKVETLLNKEERELLGL